MKALLGQALTHVEDPTKGLPDPVFQFALRIVPMINVDLLVRNAAGEHLLAWREDEYDAGWHVPGGIIRFNETIARRIAEVAASELGTEVAHGSSPADVKEFFTPRGHFISLLYLCRLRDDKKIASVLAPDSVQARHGELAWHRGVPAKLYRVHTVYSDWLAGRKG